MRRLPIVRQIALGLLLFFLLDRAIFGSGLYFPWVAPDSSLGTMVHAIDNVRHIPAGTRSILVIGDSRIGEGFSATVATRQAQQQGSPLTFTTGGVAGTLPRVWYYLIRQIDHPAQHLAAIAIMLPSYHDNDEELQAARTADIAFVHPLLSVADLSVFPPSFPGPESQWEAAKAILFKGYFYKNDVEDFIRDPAQRLQQAIAWHRDGYHWLADYPGRPTSLAGLQFDMATGVLTPGPGHAAPDPATLADYAARLRASHGQPPDNPAATSYRRTWLGRIAELCQRMDVPLIVFRIPRGPLHNEADADTQPTGVVADLANAGKLTLLPADSFGDLEYPQYFFDSLHLNHDGNAKFSPRLAELLLGKLSAGKQSP